MRRILIVAMLSLLMTGNAFAYDYGDGKRVDDKTKQSVDASVQKLSQARISVILGRTQTLLKRKNLSKKNRELLEYTAYALQSKASTQTARTPNVPKAQTSVSTTASGASSSSNGNTDYRKIKTVEELSKYVKEYQQCIDYSNDVNGADFITEKSFGELMKYSTPPSGGTFKIDFADAENIDWGKLNGPVNLSENFLFSLCGEKHTYLLSTKGFTESKFTPQTVASQRPSYQGSSSANAVGNGVIGPAYPAIKTVEELKGKVKEFVKTDDQLSYYDQDFNRISISPLGGRGFLRIDDPNSIDWVNQWTTADNNTLGENILVKLGNHNTYFLSLGGYRKSNQYLDSMTQAEYDATKKELQDTVRGLIAGKSTDDEKIGAIFDWISSNIAYNYKYFDTLYNKDGTLKKEGLSALEKLSVEDRVGAWPIRVYKYRRGVCYGYAQLFWLMAKMAGVKDVSEVGGTLGGIPHEWNKVGDYYYDSTARSRVYYKLSEAEMEKLGHKIVEGITTADE